VIGQGASDALLDSYEELRRPAAAKVLTLAGRLTRIATVQSPMARSVRNMLLRTIGRTPKIRAQLALNLSGLACRQFAPGLHPEIV
jgi:2-polyprenyl-6-methoxyphenol hydroxylase-like FAD-dependent oxidoreductase